ncbi:MAG: PilZ domain-containing protein [Syntrophaceae bacterium]|nr:PilZ domain-containing protein [Syntrophaceae bacterium]
MYLAITVLVVFVLIVVVYSFLKRQNGSGLDYPKSVKPPQNVGKEMRVHPRANVNWPVSIETPDGTIKAEVKDISLGGAFICCEKLLPVGEAFQAIMIGPDNESFAATAKVVWSNANVPDEKVINRGMGVRFIKISDRHIQLVRQLFKESD